VKHSIVWGIAFGLVSIVHAGAHTRISGTLTCAKPDPLYTVDVGDRAGHVFVLAKSACSWARPMHIEGVDTKDSHDANVVDGDDANSDSNGYDVTNMANGDKVFIRFSGTDRSMKDGKHVSTGTWRFIGGTGKFKGIMGKGTYKGSPDANGIYASEIDGDYTLPAKSRKISPE
jgi:hypothetical protein